MSYVIVNGNDFRIIYITGIRSSDIYNRHDIRTGWVERTQVEERPGHQRSLREISRMAELLRLQVSHLAQTGY